MELPLVIILAAGEGKRLGPLGQAKPKCLFPVGASSCLERALEILRQFSCDLSCIVAGHQWEQVNTYIQKQTYINTAHVCVNAEYAIKNNASSLSVALKEHLHRSFILLDGDLLFDPRLLENLVTDPRENILIVDTDQERLDDEAMKVSLSPENQCVDKISKEMRPSEAIGEYIGIAKLSAQWSGLLLEKLDQVLADPKNHQAYYEDVISLLLSEAPPVAMRPTGGLRWMEIDTPEDLKRALREWGDDESIHVCGKTRELPQEPVKY